MLTARLRDLEAAQTFDELWQTAVAVLDAEGIGSVTYLTVAADFSQPFLQTTIPALYDGYAPATDPFLHHCCTNYDITRTGSAFLGDYPYLPEAAQTFIKRAEAVGFRSGLGIPVRLVGAPRFGGVNFGTRMERAVFEDRIGSRAEEFRLFALILHRRVEDLSRPVASEPSVIDVPPVPTLVALSPREREIIWLTAKGLSRKEIARSCSLSPHTVADYTQAAYRKLGVKNRVEATRAVLGI
ncbi:LuxR family transcriptional regulator [uncultured Tateyamaria sp.]|uniref:helix-turn-helix transcriptional regulator n=1 Tax=Tateyamaria sp. 1078 TaxID=3417464 RepID=UPI002615E527|nr:LuxR family transcriptional regulator [uncultured Tateyamaria sp.]